MIVRIAPRDRFTFVPNPVIEDPKLDLKALGLLVYLLSKPDNWRVRVSQLQQRGPDGRDACYAAMSTLIEAGYATREQPRREDGSLGPVETVIRDAPHTGNPEAAPLTGSPDTGSPDTANPKLLSTEKRPSTELPITDSGSASKTPEPEPPPSAPTTAGASTSGPKRRANARAKKKSGGWVCRECGHAELRWIGRCPQCGEWMAMEEVDEEPKVGWQARSRRSPMPAAGPSPLPKPDTPMEKRLVREYPGVERPRKAIEALRKESLTDDDIQNLLRWAARKKESKQWRDGFAPALHNVILERMWETGDGPGDGDEEPAWRREQRNYFPG